MNRLIDMAFMKGACPLLVALGVGVSAQADTLLSTDFTGRTVAGNTASTITWTTLGLADPGDLTASDPLFDTPDAQGFFVPAANIGNGNPWDASILLDPTGQDVQLDSITLDTRNFGGQGQFQPVNRNAKYTLTITGSSSGQVYSANQTTPSTTGFADEVLVFTPSLLLSDSETYTLKIDAELGTTAGTHNGLNALTLEGSVVPEPASLVLLGLGGLLVIRRRR